MVCCAVLCFVVLYCVVLRSVLCGGMLCCVMFCFVILYCVYVVLGSTLCSGMLRRVMFCFIVLCCVGKYIVWWYVARCYVLLYCTVLCCEVCGVVVCCVALFYCTVLEKLVVLNNGVVLCCTSD